MTEEEQRTQFKFMIPVAVKARLEEAAQQNRRSLSAEIIERLSFSVEYPPPAVEKMKREWEAADTDLTIMETDLRSQSEEIQRLRNENRALQKNNKESADLVISMMYHVLNYMDDIPEDLTIWAYQIIRGSRHQKLLTDERSDYDLPAPDIQEVIKADRAQYRRLAIEEIKREIELPFPESESVDTPEWDWQNGQSDAPQPVEKSTKQPGKRQKR